MNIADIDPNFKTAEVGNLAVQYINAFQTPFRLTGVPWRAADGGLRRLPAELTTAEVNEGALLLSQHTAGAQLAFRTNSRYIALRADVSVLPHDMGHMPRTGSSGFDFYEHRKPCDVWCKTIVPEPKHLNGEILEQLAIPDAGRTDMREYRINFPLYGGVKMLELGFEPGAVLEAPAPYTIEKPILFYGSSITQGGCASRPGNCYSSILCRKLDAPQINLGFSGCGKGEVAVAKAIASLDLAAFVMDYDHNAPNAEHLWKTHEIFFKTIRNAHPDLPILILTRGDNWMDERTAACRATYDHAVAAGDKNVYFIEGRTYFTHLDDWHSATVDGCHPNDFGFQLMYEKVLPVLQKALGL